jgi:excinuclease UvrABC ATPase subunit
VSRLDSIRVVGARENNLKDVSLDIPKDRITVFVGVSGSGKSGRTWTPSRT